MEITIGVQHVARELVVETDQTADAVAKAVAKAIDGGTTLDLTDARGRRLLIPSRTLGYIEIGGDETRKVGFHNI